MKLLRVVARDRYPRLKRGPAGEKLCRGCGKPVPKSRQTWCSTECYETRCPAMVKIAVFKRDKGECAICHRNAEEIRKAFHRLFRRACSWQHWGLDFFPDHLEYREASKRVVAAALKSGWPHGSRAWWEADHIVPFSEGGETVLSNMRTLCYPCHLDRTKHWRGMRGSRKRRGLTITASAD